MNIFSILWKVFTRMCVLACYFNVFYVALFVDEPTTKQLASIILCSLVVVQWFYNDRSNEETSN